TGSLASGRTCSRSSRRLSACRPLRAVIDVSHASGGETEGSPLASRGIKLMACSPKRKATTSGMNNQCPTTANPRLRLASDRQTDSLRDNFPRGVATPALRALFAAGLTTLDQVTRVSEAEMGQLRVDSTDELA